VSSVVALLLLAAGLGLVIAGAEAFLDGLLASAARLGVSAFAITVAISGFELENLAAGIAANAAGLPGRPPAPSSAARPSSPSASPVSRR
jgi:hypothetical protein